MNDEREASKEARYRGGVIAAPPTGAAGEATPETRVTTLRSRVTGKRRGPSQARGVCPGGHGTADKGVARPACACPRL